MLYCCITQLPGVAWRNGTTAAKDVCQSIHLTPFIFQFCFLDNNSVFKTKSSKWQLLAMKILIGYFHSVYTVTQNGIWILILFRIQPGVKS